MTTPLILASASPRRRELLARAGYKFEVVTADVTELARSEFSLRELTIANATRKALALARRRPKAVVLAADTLVALEGEVMGKPENLDHARAILRRLSGRTHEVSTAVYIRAGGGQFASFSEISRVKFRTLSDSAINHYIRKINPLDKAGAYAAQAPGDQIIASIEGSLTNVIGLPMEKTIAALKEFGLVPRSYCVSKTTAGAGSAACAGSRRNTR